MWEAGEFWELWEFRVFYGGERGKAPQRKRRMFMARHRAPCFRPRRHPKALKTHNALKAHKKNGHYTQSNCACPADTRTRRKRPCAEQPRPAYVRLVGPVGLVRRERHLCPNRPAGARAVSTKNPGRFHGRGGVIRWVSGSGPASYAGLPSAALAKEGQTVIRLQTTVRDR